MRSGDAIQVFLVERPEGVECTRRDANGRAHKVWNARAGTQGDAPRRRSFHVDYMRRDAKEYDEMQRDAKECA